MRNAALFERSMKPALKKELLAQIRRLTGDYKWIIENETQLRLEYPDRYIAVKNKKVLFSDSTLERLIAEIKQSNMSVDEFSIELVSAQKSSLLL